MGPPGSSQPGFPSAQWFMVQLMPSAPGDTPGPTPTPGTESAQTPEPSPSGSPGPIAIVGGSEEEPRDGSDGKDGKPGSRSHREGTKGLAVTLADYAVSLPAFGTPEWQAMVTRNIIITTGSGAIFYMAFFSLGRKKRQDDEGGPMHDGRPCDGSDAGEAQVIAAADLLSAVDPAEAEIPRWRRPSLMAARKAQTVVSSDEREASRLTFAHGVSPNLGAEHRRIRYRMVRLSDAPDEIRSGELGRLDVGDEVELLERSGSFWKVRIPTGQLGWVHRMTLGDPVAVAGPSPLDALRQAPVATPGNGTAPSNGTHGGANGTGNGSNGHNGGAPEVADSAALALAARLAAMGRPVGSPAPAPVPARPPDAADMPTEGLAARLIRERRGAN